MLLVAPLPLSINATSETEFERDVIDWLSGVRSGHLGKWRYEYEPVGSLAAGGPIWEELAHHAPNYYVSREGDRALVQALDFLAQAIGRPEWIYDLGPGTLRPAIRALLSRIGKNATYVPVDVSAQFLKAAHPLKDGGLVRDVLPCLADFTRERIAQSGKGRKLFMLLGSTFGNLPMPANSDPTHEAVKFLTHIRGNMSAKDQFLLVNDGNKNKRSVLKCYTGPLNQDYYMVLPHKIAQDLKPEGDFDPLAWKPEVKWWPKTSQCSHALVAMRNQSFSIGGRFFCIPAGTALNASNSYKFDGSDLKRLLDLAGFKTITHTPHGNPLTLAVGTI